MRSANDLFFTLAVCVRRAGVCEKIYTLPERHRVGMHFVQPSIGHRSTLVYMTYALNQNIMV